MMELKILCYSMYVCTKQSPMKKCAYRWNRVRFLMVFYFNWVSIRTLLGILRFQVNFSEMLHRSRLFCNLTSMFPLYPTIMSFEHNVVFIETLASARLFLSVKFKSKFMTKFGNIVVSLSEYSGLESLQYQATFIRYAWTMSPVEGTSQSH